MIPRCATRDDIAKGLPFYDAETNEILFRGNDLVKAFHNQFRKSIDPKDAWNTMRLLACSIRTLRIKSTPVRIWVYPLHGEDKWFEERKRDQF
jgi:hypothetical protein